MSRPFLLRVAPVLLPFLLLVGTGLRGLDFGLHWDEWPWQIGPTRHMVESATLLPDYYTYPSFDYWVNLAVLSPSALTAREDVRAHLLRVLDSHAYLLRLRTVYLTVTSLALVWVYLLVLQRGGSRLEALFAACVLGGSWEVAYHLRWVASDGMLMQSATLTVLFALRALETRRQSWLMAAAVMAGVGFATKYPGGLLALPVAAAGLFSLTGSSLRGKVTKLAVIGGVVAMVFVAVTPAVLFEPGEVMEFVRYEIRHYATGHGGHTVQRGLEHAGRMLLYYSTVLLSPSAAVALLLFALAVIGMVNEFVRDVRRGAVLLVFPILYLLYFSTQGTMVVRNLLAVAPFVALCTARGAIVIGRELARLAAPLGSARVNYGVTVWGVLVSGAVLFNGAWLISSAESIVSRRTDRFVRDAAEYVRTHPDSRYLLSPRVTLDLARVAPSLPNVTGTAADADAFVLYAREGMLRWHDWPANRVDLTTAWFGPREVNFNIYPNWWGDDRIVVIDKQRATEIELVVAGLSEDAAPPVEPSALARATHASSAYAQIPADALPRSWDLPAVDPRLLVPRAHIESLVGPIAAGPVTGGWDLDGRAGTVVAADGTVLSVTVISTAAFYMERHDPASVPLPGAGVSAYLAAPAREADVRLFARSIESAVIVRVTTPSQSKASPRDLAGRVAAVALARLDAAQAATTRSQ